MSGHGWVTPNADGTKARCGGPGICPPCSIEFAQANLPKKSCEAPAWWFVSVYEGPGFRMCDEHLAAATRLIMGRHNGMLTLSRAMDGTVCEYGSVVLPLVDVRRGDVPRGVMA